MIQAEGSDAEEDISDSSDENVHLYSEETDVDCDTEVGADSGEKGDEAVPAHVVMPFSLSSLHAGVCWGRSLCFCRKVITSY